MGASLSASQVAGYLDACFGPAETGVHRDTLALVAAGAVQLREELLTAASRAGGRVRRSTAGLKFPSAASSALLLRAEALQRQREREGDREGETAADASAAVEDWRLLWESNRRVASALGRGVDWTDVFTEEVGGAKAVCPA